nr:DUF5753 domain-containing protein [Streptomyces sp. A3M-1-3]
MLHESCLRTVVGGPDIMARQLEHLISEAESPHVTLRLLPFAAGAPATGAAFTLLAFQDAPTVFHTEGPQGGRPYETAKTVAAAQETYDRLRADALSPDASVARMKDMFKERTT